VSKPRMSVVEIQATLNQLTLEEREGLFQGRLKSFGRAQAEMNALAQGIRAFLKSQSLLRNGSSVPLGLV